MSEYLYKRILLKLSGEALMGDGSYGIDPKVTDRLAKQVKELVAEGIQVGIVVGGGNIFRGMAGAAGGMDRAQADYMGMLATVMNALALQDAFEHNDVACRVMSAIQMNEVCEPYIRRRAMNHLSKGDVVIFAAGSGNPYFTTDTASALRGVEIEAEVLLKGARVDGIYTADPEKDPTAEKFDAISFDEVYSRGLKVMDLTAFTLCKENRMPIEVFDMDTEGNLMRLLAGEIQPDSGTVELGETVRIGHFSQEGRELDLNQRVYDCIHEVAAQVKTDEGTFSAKTMLERFLFTPDLQQTTIGRLSGGERRRLYLLSVLMAAPNVLLLDEPTNDLDVTTLSILEDYLQSFPGPIITVSHDRFFLDKMADTILEVRPEGRVDIFTGNWSDWARKRRPAEEKKPEKSEKTEKPQPERPREKKLKFSYNEQREFETIDAVLAELEEKLAACRRAQEACGSDYVRLQELTDEQERLSAELDEKTERWVYLNDLKEKIDAQNSQG